jgi:hypothetical protein
MLAPKREEFQMIMDWLAGLEETPLALWVSEGDLGEALLYMPIYYVMLTFHAIGMAMIVGISFVVTARLYGLFAGMPLGAIRKLIDLGWVGFWINAVSGVLLFIGHPRKELMTIAFDIKILAIALACVMLVMMTNALSQVPATAGGQAAGAAVPARARGAALAATIAWLVAMIAGRLIAYTEPPPDWFF